MRILVTGATGYVGGRLVPLLLERGHDVRTTTTTTNPDREQPWWGERVESVVMDALDAGQVAAACEGMEAVYYLIHGMGNDNFAQTDHEAATNLVDGVRACDVERIVYLSGIIPDVANDRPQPRKDGRRNRERQTRVRVDPYNEQIDEDRGRGSMTKDQAAEQALQRVFTIGHSTRDFGELLVMLRANGVTDLVDVRSFPSSRKYPQWNQDAITEALPADIRYRWIRELGGRPRRQDYLSSIRGNVKVDVVAEVRAVVAAIPAGCVAAYGEIGQAVGIDPRQAGRAVSFLDSDVPWWRIVYADGSPATCHEGKAQALLEAEGVPFRAGRVDMAKVQTAGHLSDDRS